MKRLQDVSFKFKIFFSCLLVALIPLIITNLLLVQIFHAVSMRQTYRQGEQQMQNIKIMMNDLFENCEKTCQELARDQLLANGMVNKISDDVTKDVYVNLYKAMQEIYSYAQISVCDAGGSVRYSTDTSMQGHHFSLKNGILKEVSLKNGIVFLNMLPEYKNDPYTGKTIDSVMEIACPIDIKNGARTGYIIIDFSSDSFARMFDGFFPGEEMISILDENGRMIYCSDESDQIARNIYQNIKGLSEQNSGQGNIGRENSPQTRNLPYLWYRDFRTNDYILLQKTVPVSQSMLNTVQNTSLALAVVGLVFSLIISLILSRSISRPVRVLDEAMSKVRAGDLNVRIEPENNDELGRLTERFNLMTEELNNYVKTEMKRQSDLNEARLKLYQTQLNPHFLYNTLDSIRWTARINQIPEIAVMAENLAFILRKSISSHQFITLKEELETIDDYIAIQKIRFSGKFSYETEIPDQLENCLVPKMILQPLVENAVLHGMEGTENGYICIFASLSQLSGDEDNQVLKISVTDDGCGMDQEMVRWINCEEPQKQEGHLGLYNVMNILKLYYGSQYGLKAEVIPDEGTTITISLPYKK